MTAYHLHTSISYPLAKLLRGLLPEEDEEWLGLVPHAIEHFDESGAEDDAQWLDELPKIDCVVVLCLRKRHPVLTDARDAGLRVVALHETFANMNRMQQASYITGAWTAVVAKTYRARPGTIFRVTSDKKVEEV